MDYIFGILVVIFIVIPLITLLVNTFHLYGLKLIRCHFALVKAADLKPYEKDQIRYGAQPLKVLGFEFSHFHKYYDIFQGVDQAETAAVFWHPEHRIYAEVTNPKNPDSSHPVAYKFIAVYQSHSLIGMDRDAEGVFKGFERLNCVAIDDKNGGNSVSMMFEKFLMLKADLETEQKTTQPDRLIAKSYIKRMAEDVDEYLRYLIKKSWVYKKITTVNGESSTVLCITFKAAAKLSWQLMKEKTTNKPLKQAVHLKQRESLAFLPQSEAVAHQRSNSFSHASKVKGFGKLMLFIGSVVFFGLVIGIAWETLMVLLLAPVLLFHELGHYMAMKKFGYRDLQIMFLPIGAVAMGKKESPSVLQKTWVALAGPVPGLVLALVIILWQPTFMVSVYGIGLIFMLVVINYLNLMPFMPLDGGHVVNTLLFDRWPILQFLFRLVGVLVFAYFAWAWGDPVLTFLAVFLAMGLKNNWREFQLVKCLSDTGIEQLNEFDQLTQVYTHIESQNSLFQNKISLVNAVMQRFRHARPKLRETFLGMTAYLFFLISPVVFVDQYMQMDLLSLFSIESDYEAEDAYYEYEGMDSYDEDQWDINHYLNRLDSAGSLQDKKLIYKEAMTFAQAHESTYFIRPLAAGAVTLYESNDWQTEADFKLWKKLVLEAQIFENPEQVNKLLWDELEQLMANDEAGFYRILVQSFYALKSHPYETKLARFMDKQRELGNWDIFIECLRAQHILMQNRGESEAVLLSLKQALSSVPKADNSSRSILINSYLTALFEGKHYQTILNEKESLAISGIEYGPSMKIFYIWAAIETGDIKTAKRYLEEFERELNKQDDELMESIGFLGQLLLNKQGLSQTDVSISPIKVAVALKENKDAESYLNSYLEASYLTKLSEEELTSRIEAMFFMANTDPNSPNSVQIKYILKAIKKYKPELLNNASKP